jgi:hypothetical protein
MIKAEETLRKMSKARADVLNAVSETIEGPFQVAIESEPRSPV